ncbi:hypothetical protein BT93_E2704 [Corymbia citriodora subsp. variegata]|nr:hypothetical protein BT93_E2704 [Corymbia citriodora subsp. variegata]
MEDIRLAASLFFEKEPQLKQIAQAEFSTLTLTQTQKTFEERLPGCSSHNLGAELNADGDGSITFDDFLIYRYLSHTRPMCHHCKAIIKLVFYTCLQCFADESKGPTYDLCPKCYLEKKFSHPHEQFLDNYAMVKAVRKPPMAVPSEISMGMSIAAPLGGDLLGNSLGDNVVLGSGN